MYAFANKCLLLNIIKKKSELRTSPGEAAVISIINDMCYRRKNIAVTTEVMCSQVHLPTLA